MARRKKELSLPEPWSWSVLVDGATVGRRKSRKTSGLAAGDPGKVMGAGCEAVQRSNGKTSATAATGRLGAAGKGASETRRGRKGCRGFPCDWEEGALIYPIAAGDWARRRALERSSHAVGKL